MKKKFDFSAEMSEVESIKTTPKNEYLEEEKRLLDVNAKELASLNNNVYKLRTEVENLSGSIRECKPIISEEMHKLAVEFGATLLCNFLGQIESKCKEAERRMKKADNAIHIPATAFYITIIILVALSSFFRQHHNSKCRDFTLGIDLEGCFMDYSDCYGWNYHNDTSFERIEQAQIADYYKATSLKPENQD